MQSYYSVYGTRLHLLLEDEFAANYNRAQDAFAEAQKAHKDTTGQNWQGEQMWIYWTDAEQNAFNKFADLLNLLIEVNGGSLELKEEDLTSMHLIKL